MRGKMLAWAVGVLMAAGMGLCLHAAGDPPYVFGNHIVRAKTAGDFTWSVTAADRRTGTEVLAESGTLRAGQSKTSVFTGTDGTTFVLKVSVDAGGASATFGCRATYNGRQIQKSEAVVPIP